MSTNSIDRGTKVGYMGNNDTTGSEKAPRLDAGNYPTWKPAMDVFLQRHGAGEVHKVPLPVDQWIEDRDDVSSWAQQSLSAARAAARGIKLEVADDSQPEKPDAAAAAKAAEMKAGRALLTAHVERSHKAYGSIYSAMPEYLRLEVTHDVTQGWAFGLWSWLERKFQSTEADNVSTLLTTWMNLKQKPGESFDSYRARLNAVAALLRHAKEDISPEMYCLYMLDRLQTMYTPVILALKNGTHLKDKSAIDWEAVTVLINAHERDVFRKQAEEASSEARAMSARTEDSTSHSGSGSGSGSQNNGNGGGHGRGQRRRARDLTNVTCYNCQEKGHYKDKCTKPRKERDSTDTAASVAAGSKRVEQTSSVVAKEFSFAVVVQQGPVKSESCATPHPRPPIRRNLSIASQWGNQSYVTVKKSGPEIPEPGSDSSSLPPVVPAAAGASDEVESDVKDSSVNYVRIERIRRRRLKLKEKRKLNKVLAATSSDMSATSSADVKDVGIDSMASVNVNGNKLNFIPGSLKPCEPFSVLVADNGEVEVSMVGSIELNINTSLGHTVTFIVDDVYYHPRFGANLISLNWLTAHGWKFYSDQVESFLLTPNELKIPLHKEKRVCILRCVHKKNRSADDQVYHIGVADIKWDSAADLVRLHEKLGHMGFDRLVRIVKQGETDGIGKLNMSTDVLKEARKRVMECRACKRGKGTRTAFGHRGIDKGSAPGETLHMDTFYIKYEKMDGTPHIEYGLTVSDPYTTFKWYQCLQSKDLVAKAVIDIIENAQTQFGCTVKRLLTDGGTEFINRTLKDHCLKEGIELHYPPARTPQLNSVAERSVRSCKDAGRTLLMHACLPGNFGSFAVQHAVYLWNRTNIAPSTGKTPYEVMLKKKPCLEHVSVFGCDSYFHVPKEQRDATFSDKMIPGIYLGHSHMREGAFMWDLRSGDVVLTRDVEYLDRRFTHSAALLAGGEQLQAVISGAYYTRDNTPLAGVDVADVNFDDSLDGTETHDQHSGVWDVQCIIGKRSNNGTVEYCVKWIGFDKDTWEPASNVEDGAREAIEEFESNQGSQSDDNVVAPPYASPSPDPSESAAVSAAPDLASHVTSTSAPSAPAVPANRRSARSHASSAALDALTGQHLVHMALSAICSSLPGGDSCFSETDMQCFEAVRNGLQHVYAVSGGLSLLEDRTPNTYKEAAASPDAAKWKIAMDKEMSGCQKMAVWVEVPRSSVSKWQVITCKWVFKIKVNSDGEVDQFKARITPKGFMQLLGINYSETFAATGKYKSLRLGLSISAGCDHELDQMDVPQAFLNADVDEDIYMELPEGYREGKQHLVCKLKKSLYGLKQAPRNWYLLISKFISGNIGYKATVSDPCLFFRRSRTGRLMLLFLFVDDFQSSYHMEDKSEWNELKQKLVDRFQTKDLGPSTWILGMCITRDRKLRTIKLDQELYVTKALERYGLDQCTPVATPGLCGSPIIVDKADGTQPADRQLFQEMVGSLMYAAISARPDIAHAVQQLARAMQNPTQLHMQAAKRVFRYLAGTKDIGMIFGSRNGDKPLDTRGRNSFRLDVCAFADADWANDKTDRKSITGWVAKVNGDPISWASKKQRTVAQSTCEAELYAEAAAIQEVLWMRGLLKELGLHVQTGSLIHGDNQSTIAVSKNGVKGERTKHVDVKYHFITETVESGSVQLKWVPTTEQQADIFTKALPTPVFEHFRRALMTR
jgi:hypothetical protein